MSEPYGIPAPAFRLPAETHVGKVTLRVSDLDRSRDYYTRFLGMQELSAEADRVVLGAGDTPLVELQPGARATQTSRRLGLYHFAILLPDRAALGRFLAHALEAGVQPGASDHLVSEALYLSDPDGLGIEIYRDRPRTEWRKAGDQLAMTAEPLDFDGVIAAANGQSWGGMPEDSVMGHVHLHVGSIDAAKRFYHEALGLDLMVWSYPGALFLSAGGYHHHLGLNTWAGPRATPPAPDEPALLSWDLILPAASTVAEAVQRVVSAEFAVAPAEHGDDYLMDPWGTVVRLRTNV